MDCPVEFRYSYNRIDTFDALFNFIIGIRGDGKTFGWKKKVIKNWEKTGRCGLYLRRTEGELKKSKKKFLKDLTLPEWSKYEFKLTEDEVLIREINEDEPNEWKPLLYFAYLANSVKYKSVSYADVDLICYDEVFIKETKDMRYLTDEVNFCFLPFYETVARDRDVKVYFLSNAISVINPYFCFWDIRIKDNTPKIKRFRDDIVVEIVDDSKFREFKKATRFGKLVKDTEYEASSIDNEFVYDSPERIQKKSKKSFYWITLVYKKQEFAIYYDKESMIFYCSNNINSECTKKIIINDGRFKWSSLSGGRQYQLRILAAAFRNERLFFENQKCKHAVEPLMFNL